MLVEVGTTNNMSTGSCLGRSVEYLGTMGVCFGRDQYIVVYCIIWVWGLPGEISHPHPQCQNAETLKCRNAETPKRRNVETPKRRNAETPKCRMAYGEGCSLYNGITTAVEKWKSLPLGGLVGLPPPVFIFFYSGGKLKTRTEKKERKNRWTKDWRRSPFPSAQISLHPLQEDTGFGRLNGGAK